MTAFGLSFLVSLACCMALGLFVPVPAAPFEAHLSRRLMRMGGRGIVVFAVVAAGAGGLGAFPPIVLAGAVAGWLVPALVEWRRFAPSWTSGARREAR